jgi:hypothetical protein
MPYLDNWVRLVATDIGTYQTALTGASTTYLTYVANKGWVLNQTGGAIFGNVIPKLQTVRPSLFQITSDIPVITTTPVATPNVDNMNYKARLGTYLSGLLEQFSTATGINDPALAGGLLIVGVYGVIAFTSVIKGFAWAGLIAAFPMLLLGMYYGLLEIRMLLMMLVIIAFLFVKEFIFKWG